MMIFSTTFVETFRPISFSINKIKILPPSSAGMGIALKIPIFNEIIANKLKYMSNPYCTDLLVTFKMPTGPDKFSNPCP